ncbi:hypothetical protein [Glycomyces sp. YM15]|uniref:hypothetical protein n=1 Tax=Glycomyces sp. YM15 TaxID=2800446 RepID=UPI0019642476|nr:hypothetical protein [Glycomyces sp. YM15]
MTLPLAVAAGAPTASALLLTAIISASTAAVVALGIEWFAKPSLEARKERILEQHKNMRALLNMALDDNMRLEWHELFDRDVDSSVDRNEVIRLVAVTRPPRTKQNRRAYKIISEIMTGNMDQWRANDLWGYLDSALAVITTPWWNVRRRRYFIAQLDKSDASVARWKADERKRRKAAEERGTASADEVPAAD